MKILYITLENLSRHKGSVVHVKETVRGLQKLGHRVGLVASFSGKIEVGDRSFNLHPEKSFLVRLLGSDRKSYFISAILLFVYLFRILPHYDIVYARDYHAVIIALLPRLIFKKKLVSEINGLANEEQSLKGPSIANRILVWFVRKAESLATGCSDRIITVTPLIADYLVHHFHTQREKIEVVGNGVDIGRFRPIIDEALLAPYRNRMGINPEDRVVAFVGNLARWQGVEFLIESALRLLSRGEKVKVLIIGDGPLKNDLMNGVRISRYDEKFIFTGMVDYEEIPFLINTADVCAAPFISRRNQKTGVSPLKVFEYMACGKSVVSSRIKGLEFIETEGVGLLTEPEDVTGIEMALRNLLSDPQGRLSMGLKGLEFARQRFNWDMKVRQIEEILGRLA